MVPTGEQVHSFDIYQFLAGLIVLTKLVIGIECSSISLVNVLNEQEAFSIIQTVLQERSTLK